MVCQVSYYLSIALVEGEKKALALQRLTLYDSETPRFLPIAIAGVWSWRGRTGRSTGPNGERIDVKGPIPDLSRIGWKGRKVFVVFDANVHSNDSVKWARQGIAKELTGRGAEVVFVNLPEDCGVNGVDDLLAAWGPVRVLALFDAAVSAEHSRVVPSSQYETRPSGLYRVTKKGEQVTETQLSNYTASITANIRLDDGIEVKSEFEIVSELQGRSSRFVIRASQFASMDWPIEQMGPGAITYPNKREYVRTAVQSYSMEAEERWIYTHTGWRKINGRWVYFHSGGAIGESGVIAGIDVQLSGLLSRYQLRLPTGPDALVCAIRASLRLADLGPQSLSFPLRSATCRAVLGGCDFALHLAGETGAFKSELAALEQQHFGLGMNRLNLPGAWSSTGNALEILTFHAKDALVVIDDFAPQGNTSDVSRYHAAADRVFRSAGNHAGRGRLDSTARLREVKPPRGLILSTGEDIPRGHSIRARLLILELAKGQISPIKLTECQREAEAGLYAGSTAGFVRWLAGSYETRQDGFRRRVSGLRATARSNTDHARTPEIVANLQAAFELYLEFSEESRAIDAAERERLKTRNWEALREASAAQAKHQAATEPTQRFLSLLRASLVSGQAHLAERNGAEPGRSPESCGWRRDCSGKFSPLGDCIGWVDGDHIYLEPTAAHRVVQTASRDGCDVLAVSEHTLRKRLHDKGLLASVDEARQTLTVRRSIGGSSKSVLHFLRSTILPELPDGNENSE